MAEHVSQTSIAVWIVEDDADDRNALRGLLGADDALHCTGAFIHVEALTEALDGDALPDVVLMDLYLPGASGLDGVTRVRERHPDLPVVMLTVADEADIIFEALRAGASGYLTKEATDEQITLTLREAHQGGMIMPAPVARKVLRFFRSHKPVKNYGLTRREKEVLQSMAEGLVQKEIAEQLYVSPHTVNTHIQHIYEKLHVHSGREAVAKALRESLIQ